MTDYYAALSRWNEDVGKPWDKAKDDWRKAQAAGQELGTPEPQPASPQPSSVHPPDGDTNTPGNLFNAMISPLMPLAIKGVIWYQGVWAKAEIEGDSVVVSSDKVAAPVAVRYDFEDSPQGNLYNKEGLPASPFRTDGWNDKDR